MDKKIEKLNQDVLDILNIITKDLIVKKGMENSSKFNRDLRVFLTNYKD